MPDNVTAVVTPMYFIGISGVKAESLTPVQQTLRAIVVLHAGVKRALLDLVRDQFPGRPSVRPRIYMCLTGTLCTRCENIQQPSQCCGDFGDGRGSFSRRGKTCA